MNYPFKLQFVQVESDAIFIYEANVLTTIKDDFNRFRIESNKQYQKLQNESNENIKSYKMSPIKNIKTLKNNTET